MKPGYLIFALLLVGAALYQEYQQQPKPRSSSAEVNAGEQFARPAVNTAKHTINNSSSHAKLPHNRPIKDYKTARYLLWDKVYKDGGSTLYCGEPFGARHGKGINVEHVFPMSWVTNSLDCGTRDTCRRKNKTFNYIEADLHNLFPSRTDVNKDRSSYRFGEIPGEARHYGKLCDFEASQRSRIAEPAPEVDADRASTNGTGAVVDREPPFPRPEPPAGSDEPAPEEAGVIAPNMPTCAAPSELVDGECVPPVIIDCAPGFKLVDGECIFNPPTFELQVLTPGA